MSRGALAQRAAHPVEEVLVRELPLDVGVGEPVVAHVGDGAVVVEELRVADVPSSNGHQMFGLGDEHLVAVAPQVELVDDPLVEQADDVGARADRVAVVGERALERARAAEPLAALEHEHRLAGLGEVRRAR